MSGNKGTIFVADDHEGIRDLIVDLIPSGYNIEQFPTGDGLGKRLEGDVNNLKLVITDNDMGPGKTGVQVIREYAPGNPQVPFLLYCTPPNQEIRDIIQLPNVSYSPKLTSLPELRVTINGLLEKSL